MDMPTFRWWVERASQIEKERNDWRDLARRLANPEHDDDCQYGAHCSYCAAVEKATTKR